MKSFKRVEETLIDSFMEENELFKNEQLQILNSINESTEDEAEKKIINLCRNRLAQIEDWQRRIEKVREGMKDNENNATILLERKIEIFASVFSKCEKEFKILSWLLYLTAIYFAILKIGELAFDNLSNFFAYNDSYFLRQAIVSFMPWIMLLAIFVYLETKFFRVLTARLDLLCERLRLRIVRRSARTKSMTHLRYLIIIFKSLPYLLIFLTFLAQFLTFILIFSMKK